MAFAVVFAFVLAAAPTALAEKRVALVVGVNDYPNLKSDQQLKKAVNDARSVAETLRVLNYDVKVGENVSGLEFDRLWQDFLNRIEPGDLSAFFFSGHGVQLKDGVNYLLPREVPAVAPSEETVLKRQSVSFADLLSDLRQRGARVSLMILDACRDDPFVEPGRKSVVGTRGLARVEPPEGTFVMFSAGAGESALDRLSETDGSPNSVYTRQLLPLLPTPGLTLPDAAEQVREKVHALARTSPAHPNHKQRPAYYNEIIGKFCLAGCDKEDGSKGKPAGPAATAPPQPPFSEAAQAWRAIESTASVAVLEAFSRQFPDSVYATFARARIPELQAKEERERKEKEPKLAIGTYPEPSRPEPVPPACDGIRAKVGNEGRCLKPKDTFRDCSDCPEMVLIPAGRFAMGSPESEKDRDKDEGPQHEVRIAKPFAVGKFEVTRGQYADFIRDSGHSMADECWTYENDKVEERSGRSFRSPGFPQDNSHPVVCVNWDDAKAFAAWLGRKTGQSYRLLSEAEWEYAARAGTASRYHFGDREGELCSFANGADRAVKEKYKKWESPIVDCRDGYANTAPAGRFQANGFGLYDVHGNVWEWTEDCYHDSYQGAPSNGSAWTTGACESRLLRGGSGVGSPRGLRAAIRHGVRPGVRFDVFGFRVARTLAP